LQRFLNPLSIGQSSIWAGWFCNPWHLVWFNFLLQNFLPPVNDWHHRALQNFASAFEEADFLAQASGKQIVMAALIGTTAMKALEVALQSTP
jgi:hypothetical protein